MERPLRTLIAVVASAACLAAFAPPVRADIEYYTPPKFKHKVLPVYPDAARAAHETGTVILKVLVATDGTPKQFIIFKSSGHKDLDAAVLAAAKASTYYPAVRGNAPQTAFYDVTYKFTLTGVASDEGSQSDLAKKLDANPADVSTRLALGTDYLNAKNYSQAEDLFKTGTTVVPKNAKIWAYLGLSYFQDAQANDNNPDKFKSAADAYDQALALDPKVETSNIAALSYFNYGFHLQQTNDAAGALAYAQKAVALAPNESQYYILLGEAQTSQGDFASAIATLKKAEALDAKLPAGQRNSTVTSRVIADEANAELMQGDKADGMADIERAKQANGQAAFAYEYLYSYYLRSGNRAAAIGPLTQLAQLQPREISWQLQIGNLYMGLNNAGAAKDSFQRALALDPTSADAQFGMAELAASTGDTAGIGPIMQKITPGADGKKLAIWNSSLAILLLNASAGNKTYYNDAATYALAATKADPNNASGWYTLGVAQAQQGDKTSANASLKKAYDIYKAQNDADGMKQVSGAYKQINGTELSGDSY